jgi:hypothetical protein
MTQKSTPRLDLWVLKSEESLKNSAVNLNFWVLKHKNSKNSAATLCSWVLKAWRNIQKNSAAKWYFEVFLEPEETLKI